VIQQSPGGGTGNTERKLMDELIKAWDGECVIVSHDRPSGAWIFIAIHSTKLGPAIGGTRMKHYSELKDALEDAQRLAAGMTYKWAAAGLRGGGGKAVIALDHPLDQQERASLLRRYGTLVRKHRGLFLTGPDLGTSSEDMDIIAQEAPSLVFGRTLEAGGGGNPAPFTARGIFTALETTAQRLFGKGGLSGKKILVQGAGSVGRELIHLLQGCGCEVLFSDIEEETVRLHRNEKGLSFVPPEAVYETACDIFAPCAVGGVLNEESIPRLRCRAVVGGANNQLAAPEDARRLQDRGVLYAPDFVANSGGAIALIGIETRGWSREEAMRRVVKAVRDNLEAIYRTADHEGISTDEAARRLAQRRIDEGAPENEDS